MRLKGKVGLITGAGSGIGRATAILFAREGAKVVAVDRETSGDATATIVNDSRGEAIFIQADISKARDAESMIEKAVDSYGKLDILFNNAGILLKASIDKTDEEAWDKVIDVNLKGVFLGCKYAIPIMMRQGGGAIINTGSCLAFVAGKYLGAYCASKGGVVALTKAIALEVAPHNIRVNCICPSTTMTPMVEQAWARSGKPDQMRESEEKMHPLGRLGKPDDVAYAALYLASDESSFMTGSTLLVDGGYTVQ